MFKFDFPNRKAVKNVFNKNDPEFPEIHLFTTNLIIEKCISYKGAYLLSLYWI